MKKSEVKKGKLVRIYDKKDPLHLSTGVIVQDGLLHDHVQVMITEVGPQAGEMFNVGDEEGFRPVRVVELLKDPHVLTDEVGDIWGVFTGTKAHIEDKVKDSIEFAFGPVTLNGFCLGSVFTAKTENFSKEFYLTKVDIK